MAIDRTLILKGPARVVYDAIGANAILYSKDDIIVKPINTTFEIGSSRFGRLDDRDSGRMIEVTFTPVGEWEYLAALFPYAGTNIGASIFGATDKTLTIHTVAGVLLTLKNVAITSMPSIRCSVGETLLGPVTFTAILANNTDPSNAAALFTIGSSAYPTDESALSIAAIKTLAFASNWDGKGAPWEPFNTETGWTIDFELGLSDESVDGLGVVDKSLASLAVNASAIPVGPTEAEVWTALALQGTALGTSRAAAAADLNISASGVYIRVANAYLQKVDDFAHGQDRKTIGNCTWAAARTFAVVGGAPENLFYVGTGAPA